MQVLRLLHDQDPSPVGIGVRVLLLSPDGEASEIVQRLQRLGGQVEVVDEVFTALSQVLDDPVGYGLFVLDCDTVNLGGLDGGMRAVHMMGELVSRVPVILVSSDTGEQRFPEDRLMPTQLRAPLSALSLRIGFEHALRERLAYRDM